MLAINTDKFMKVVSESIEKVAFTVDNEKLARRWVNAIERAADLVETQPEFITWDDDKKEVLVWSLESNQIYTANGRCQCRAFAKGDPCKHRALARLLKTYFEPVKVATAPKIENAPYLKANSTAAPLQVGRYRI